MKAWGLSALGRTHEVTDDCPVSGMLPSSRQRDEAPMTAAANEPAVLQVEVLTVPELAILLRLKTKSVYALLSRDPAAIPGCRKVGGAWRAHRATVLTWLAGQNSDARQRQRGVR